ncbi:hypothetical protein EYF80_008839 [Liparis tanakae]|uniref:Uncharacterized protein n=1 Tax=Liparis tanakae TaxID=230148 RepID=A0A4Z2ITH6_9TELE|nr:hypothetical protein EYF80_008839 [Liparis tanakae]
MVILVTPWTGFRPSLDMAYTTHTVRRLLTSSSGNLELPSSPPPASEISSMDFQQAKLDSEAPSPTNSSSAIRSLFLH